MNVPCHIELSHLKISALVSWGIEPEKLTHLILKPCEKLLHCNHVHMVPFHFNNNELLAYYDDILERKDESVKEAIKDQHDALKRIKVDPSRTPHENTAFHCTGHPFNITGYKETDWVVRLHHALQSHDHLLPENVFL